MVSFKYSILDTFLLVGGVFLLVKQMVPGVPLAGLLRQVRDRLSQPAYLLCLFAAFVASLVDYIETHFDAQITRFVHRDYTPVVSRFGPHVVEWIQPHRQLWMTYLFTYAYFWLFPAIMFAVFLALVYEDKREVAQFLVAGYFCNLLVVLPFYLFFPVNEVWVSDFQVRLLPDTISPLIMEHFRSKSALDNCFPSFHTSLAILIALAAWRAAQPRMILWANMSAALVISSTLYLGIHWPLDIISGLLAALFCAWLSSNFGLQAFAAAELRFRQLRQVANYWISV